MTGRFLTAFLFVLLSSAQLCAQSTPSRVVNLFLPDRKGGLVVDLGDLRMEQGGLRPDGRQFKLIAKGADGVYLSAFVEVAPRPGNNEDVRSDWWNGTKKNSPLPVQDIHLTSTPSAAEVRYIVKEYQGIKDHRSVHAYYGGEQIWAEVHISKTPSPNVEDEVLFNRILERVKMVQDFSPSSRDWFLVGSTYYRTRDYKKASLYLQRALDLEKQSAQLDPVLWKVLVDNLGMAYGISGDLSHAKSVFEYGLSKDPEYPLFYYNLACTFGEMKQMQPAMDNLKLAFERRKNVIPGEHMPDPANDDSFAKFMKDPKFREFVAALPR